MSDDNFFNKSINEAAGTGFAATLVANGEVPVGTSLIDTTNGDVAATLPPATVGAGASVTIVVSNLTNDTTVAVVAPSKINGAAGPVALAALGLYTFVSDGVSNWLYTA